MITEKAHDHGPLSGLENGIQALGIKRQLGDPVREVTIPLEEKKSSV
jgi:hypothetical protein